jgi:hypothetical protein
MATAPCPKFTIDSNVTGLRFAEETCIKQLPANPTWYQLEPNSYSDFGGQVTLIARNPINPSRQRKKGVITDLDASGGFQQDLTQTNLTRLFQGYFFADWREKASTAPINGTTIPLTGVTTTGYAAASGLNKFMVGQIVMASGFAMIDNNGLKTVSSATATNVGVSQTLIAEPTPPATAKLQVVGFQFAAAALSVVVTGSNVHLTSSSINFTTLGLVPGEWVFIGGDAPTDQFGTATNNGFARIRSVTSTFIELDKTSSTMLSDAGTGKTIRLWFGNILRNEEDPTLIKRRSYQLERTLGNDQDGVMSEYLIGAVANEMTVNIAQADKINVDLSFVAVDNEQRTGAQGIKPGTRVDNVETAAFNTSSDFSRIKLHLVDEANTNPAPLFAFLTEMNLSINNNVTPTKAVAVLGAFDTTAGTFEVSGSLTAYFASIEAVQAVRNNADVSLDLAIVKNNAGLVWDVPLIGLGDGRLNVEQDNPITLPLNTDAAESKFGYTLQLTDFAYLPALADI